MSELEALYTPAPVPASTRKVARRITPHYAKLIEVSPFCAFATIGPEGVDCSPRGDKPGFVRIADDKTLMMPDRRGNNRIDSLRNIIRDPRVALMFLIPGFGNTLRVIGRAHLVNDAAIAESFVEEGKVPRCVIVTEVEEVYFQCARAIIRARLWDQDAQVDPTTLPTPGEILAGMTQGEVGGKPYDDAWMERAKATMW
jgi:PPOX class probable FMN-dependent enzyme